MHQGKGQESMLCHMGHIIVSDSVTGIIRACCVTQATGTAEVESALSMADEHLKAGTDLGWGPFVRPGEVHPRAPRSWVCVPIPGPS